MNRNNFIVLVAIFATFLALGMPDGAFGVAWPSIRGDFDMGLDQAFILVIAHSIFYSIAGWQMDRLAGWIKLPNVNMLGMALILVGVGGFALSPSMYFFVAFTMVLGLGMGLVDSSLNAYTAKYFAVRHMHWLHCFWGMGGALSPIIMSQMIMLFSWRLGYGAVFAMQASIGFFLLLTLLKGYWQRVKKIEEQQSVAAASRAFLTKRRYPIMQMAIFLVYVGAEYAVTFWTTSVMLESRGMEIRVAGLYPAVYLGFMTGGRAVIGFVSKKMSNSTIIRGGLAISLAGFVVMTFSNNILGMALIGFGFGPVFPGLMHETGLRFSPEATTKLVGYQIAAVGMGVASSTFGMGRLLAGVSLEALFPVAMVLVVAVAVLNEIIEFACKKL
ncbi:MAG: MFS transporter [Defluviitaleaceae bacterium]|nr:MFS transporter [Defluviitaleaceae bacterium]